jgi:hypothetical protein
MLLDHKNTYNVRLPGEEIRPTKNEIAYEANLLAD